MPAEAGKSSLYEFPWPGDNQAPNGPLEFEELAKKMDAVKLLSQSLKPTVGAKAFSESSLTLTTSYQDLAGATLTVTPTVASTLLVVTTFSLSAEVASGTETEAFGALTVDGTAEARTAHASVGMAGTFSQIYAVALTAAAHTVKLQAKKAGLGPAFARGNSQGGSAFLYALFAS